VTAPAPSGSTIGIVGHSYSGSTVLSLMLGGAHEVFATCELEELRRRPPVARCRLCREACSFWTPDFVQQCAATDRLHEIILDRAMTRLGKRILVSADKNPRIYHRAMQRGDRIDGFLLLFKRPEGHAFSFMTHERCDLAAALDEYAVICTRSLELLAQSDRPHLVVDYDDLARSPVATLTRICAFFGITFAADMIEYWRHPRRFHTLSGNSGAYAQFFEPPRAAAELEQAYWKEEYSPAHGRWLLTHLHEIALDEKWREGLSGAQQEEIHRHRGSQETFERLLALKIWPTSTAEGGTL
jgi:hypothetical protein